MCNQAITSHTLLALPLCASFVLKNVLSRSYQEAGFCVQFDKGGHPDHPNGPSSGAAIGYGIPLLLLSYTVDKCY